ncbi:prophage maintenance system killer protein [Brachybacterium muris]|nr:prophage maintenance system killer protein [Brachybacterium muris]
MDGNERLGWLAVVVFYGLNGVDLEAPDDDAYDLVEYSPRWGPLIEGSGATSLP